MVLTVLSLYFLKLKRKLSVSGILALFLSFTVFLSFLIGRNAKIDSLTDFLNLCYVALLLFFLVSAFKGYHSVRELGSISNASKIKTVAIWVGILGIFALLMNVFIVYKSISLILLDSIDVTSFKNEGEAADMIKSMAPGPVLFLTHLFSPTAYIAFALHFYYFIRGKVGASILFFLVALNMPLHGLHGLSRSAPTQFIIMYGFSLLYIFPAFPKRLRKKLMGFGSVFFIGILTIMVVITKSRFDDSSFYDSRIPVNSVIQDKTLFSVADYLSQWNEQGIITMGEFTRDKIWYGKSSTPFATIFAKKVFGDAESYVDVRNRTLGRNASSFNGLVSTLVYDFGYFGAFIFTFIFYFIARKNAPKNGYLSFVRFSTFSALIAIPAMSFGNNAMSGLMFSIAIVYLILLNLYFRIDFSTRSKRVTSAANSVGLSS